MGIGDWALGPIPNIIIRAYFGIIEINKLIN